MIPAYEILDISQPIDRQTACFPGDVPFQRDITLTYEDSQIINLTAFTMSPHVGSHADAPVHIQGTLEHAGGTAGQLSLSPYLGPAVVVDVAPCTSPIRPEDIIGQLSDLKPFPERILFRTAHHIRYDVFEPQYASFSPELAEFLASRGARLIGIDTPSVDPVDSKTLETHHIFLKHNLSWLENLDLTQVTPGAYFLIALPLKFSELEASPVRAVLLRFAS